MNLLLMRHAKSSREDDELDDHDRPLNHRGREAAPRMAQVLVESDLVPSRILVSSSARTRETVERMLPILGAVQVEVIPKLYHAMPLTILQVINDHGQGADPLLIVGHNPGMETTVSNISGNIVPFPTGAIAHAVLKPNESSEVMAVWRPGEFPAE
jgi:phosphohistidine phosphatase